MQVDKRFLKYSLLLLISAVNIYPMACFPWAVSKYAYVDTQKLITSLECVTDTADIDSDMVLRELGNGSLESIKSSLNYQKPSLIYQSNENIKSLQTIAVKFPKCNLSDAVKIVTYKNTIDYINNIDYSLSLSLDVKELLSFSSCILDNSNDVDTFDKKQVILIEYDALAKLTARDNKIQINNYTFSNLAKKYSKCNPPKYSAVGGQISDPIVPPKVPVQAPSLAKSYCIVLGSESNGLINVNGNEYLKVIKGIIKDSSLDINTRNLAIEIEKPTLNQIKTSKDGNIKVFKAYIDRLGISTSTSKCT